jgi:hypothetical protein
MREAIRGDEGDNQCPRVPGRSRQGAGFFQGLSQHGTERGSRVEWACSKRRKWSSTYLQKCEHKHALAHGEHWQLELHRRDEKERATACARPARAAQTGSAALRRDSTQTSPSRHMSCTRKRRGAQPLPENSGFPSPQLMQRSLSLPVLLACICRSMRWLLSTHDADRILVRILFPHSV